MCMVNDGDYSVIWEVTTPKARKQYVCCECGVAINPGDTYERVKSLYDGRWWNYKTCTFCTGAAWWLETQCDGYIKTRLWEDLGEHWAEGYRGRPIGHNGKEVSSGRTLQQILQQFDQHMAEHRGEEWLDKRTGRDGEWWEDMHNYIT